MRILIVHFNTPDLTSRLVRDLPGQTPHGRDIFVHLLDNGSTPENCARLQTSVTGMPRVELTLSARNLGFGQGVNALFESSPICESDILWILNPDTRLDEGCLRRLENELTTDDFAIVSPLIYSGDSGDSWIWYCGGSLDVRNVRVQHQLYGRSPDEAPQHSFETEFVTGAGPMMFASTFRRVGGFPCGYFLYWEDAYFSWTARQLGLRLGVVPSAHLWHAVGASSGYGQSRIFYYWFARNRFKFAHDIGIPRRRLVLGRGGLESIRPIAKALLESDGWRGKFTAALRGSLRGLVHDTRAADTELNTD